jgi:hypothetical protein
MLDPRSLDRALEALGIVLADQGLAYELVAVGGSALLLLGLIERPTQDLDIVGIVDSGRYVNAKPLPKPLIDAVQDVGETLGLGPHWLNAGPTDLLNFGLPDGFEDRVTRRAFGPLILNIASREDQVCFKLYAAVDRGPDSKHFQDLKALQPTRDELLLAARWSITHDPSEPYRDWLIQALAALGIEDADAEL